MTKSSSTKSSSTKSSSTKSSSIKSSSKKSSSTKAFAIAAAVVAIALAAGIEQPETSPTVMTLAGEAPGAVEAGRQAGQAPADLARGAGEELIASRKAEPAEITRPDASCATEATRRDVSSGGATYCN